MIQPSHPSSVLRRLGVAIRGMKELAVEQISDGSDEDPFQVLISTMLSAQTRDAVTLAASTRLFNPIGLLRWLATTAHNRIGILYMTAAFGFFFFGGLLALVIRTELAA